MYHLQIGRNRTRMSNFRRTKPQNMKLLYLKVLVTIVLSLLSAIIVSAFGQSGCTNALACNYDPNAVSDDGSCAYLIDCAGICGGNYVLDACGNCYDPNGLGQEEILNFAYTGFVEAWEIPQGVFQIRVEASGAQGGTNGGLGARISGTFSVIPGEIINVVVGKQGYAQVGGNVQNSSGGGGGTFVYKSDNTLFIAAGGGGGKCNYSGSPPLHAGAAGQAGTSGGNSSDGNVGGANGQGGPAGLWGANACSGGGAGWLSAGGGAYGGQSIPSWAGGNGFCGGGGGGCGGAGGFGGGGGGGGYSGGAGGTDLLTAVAVAPTTEEATRLTSAALKPAMDT